MSTRLRREVRSAIVSACTALGVLIGLAWALHHAPGTLPACHGAGPRALGRCTSHSLALTLRPYMIGIGGGALTGMLVAAVLVLFLWSRPKPSR